MTKNLEVSIAQTAKHKALSELVIGDNAKYKDEYKALYEKYKKELTPKPEEKKPEEQTEDPLKSVEPISNSSPDENQTQESKEEKPSDQ